MPRYYHCIPHAFAQDALTEGLRPGKALGIQSQFLGIPIDNSYIYLWKNLDMLEGRLYREFLEDGTDFFCLDIPKTHPVERDLDARVLIQKSPDMLLLLMKLMKIDFSPTDYIDECVLLKYAAALHGLPHKQKIMIMAQKVCTELARDPDTLGDILSRPAVRDWDRVIGFYRTRQPIVPVPGYSIRLHSSIY
jgi:hypothetical protein